jgi:hypothetical protein
MRRRRSSANVLAMFSIMKNLQTSQKWKWYMAHKTWSWFSCVICKWRERSCQKKVAHTKLENDILPCVLHKL